MSDHRMKLTPAQARTAAHLFAMAVIVPALVIVWAAGLEVKTLADDEPGNHITATVRAAFAAQPGGFVVLGGAWFGFLLWLASGIGGHIFWGIGG